MRSLKIPRYIQKLSSIRNDNENFLSVKAAYGKLNSCDHPVISIVIPAYNEEHNILKTLASLCYNHINECIEIIVVDNNSTDNTRNIVDSCGIRSIIEKKQGITYARNAGLFTARGTFVLNADADTIYPQNWIEEMVKPLRNSDIAITYGTFSFIPIGKTSRLTYFLYEYFSEMSRFFNRFLKDEAVNVYGFNSAFKKADALLVEGFNHPKGTNEDGWLALKLRKAGLGRIYYIKSAMVWTTDRRIQLDGGLVPGIMKRMKRFLLRK